MVNQHKLVKNLIDLGVHIGTDLSHGYNRQYNEYIISIIPYKEKSFYIRMNQRHRDSGRTRRIPIIDLSKSLFFLKRAASFIRGVSMGMGNLLLYHETLYENINFLVIFARIVNKRNHAFLHKPWQYGTLTNYYTCFYTMIRELHDYDSLKRRKNISFTGLFSRLLIYSYLNIPRDKTVEEHTQSCLKYWRAIVFLRYFRGFYMIPDVIITLNPTGAVGAIDEGGTLGVPVVAAVDTDGHFTSVTYPLLSNDDSHVIALYYFVLFMNVYESGRVERFRYNMPNVRKRDIPQKEIKIKFVRSKKKKKSKLGAPYNINKKEARHVCTVRSKKKSNRKSLVSLVSEGVKKYKFGAIGQLKKRKARVAAMRARKEQIMKKRRMLYAQYRAYRRNKHRLKKLAKL